MSNKAEKASDGLRSTIICAVQSTGRIGKSTTIQSIASWLEFAGVRWAGVDTDTEHRSFSARFANVAHVAIERADGLDAIFRFAGLKSAVALIDFPAGATTSILAHIQARRVLDAL